MSRSSEHTPQGGRSFQFSLRGMMCGVVLTACMMALLRFATDYSLSGSVLMTILWVGLLVWFAILPLKRLSAGSATVLEFVAHGLSWVLLFPVMRFRLYYFLPKVAKVRVDLAVDWPAVTLLTIHMADWVTNHYYVVLPALLVLIAIDAVVFFRLRREGTTATRSTWWSCFMMIWPAGATILSLAALWAPALKIAKYHGQRAWPRMFAPWVSYEVQPDRLDFGTVRVGATVEGSVRILRDGDDIAGLPVRVEPPPFVKVKGIQLGTQEYGTLGTKVFCDISVSLTTQPAGQRNGSLRVELIPRRVLEIPVAVNVLPQQPGLTRVLIVETPFGKYSTDDANLFTPWLDLVKEANLDVHYRDVTPKQPVLRGKDLSQFQVVLLAETGLVELTERDVTRLQQFVDNGGRLIVAANHFFGGTVEKANVFLIPAGLRMTDTEQAGGGEFDLKRDNIADHPLTKSVKTVRFHRPSPIAVTNQATGKVLVKAPPYPGEGFVAIVRSGKGDIIAVSDSLWWNWIGNPSATGADNALLLKNLLTGRN